MDSNHAWDQKLFVMLVEVIPCLPVILESPCLQIVSLRFLGLLVRKLGRVAPLPVLFVLADLLVRLSDR